jgi:hypothetical protein
MIEAIAGIIYDSRRNKCIDTHDPWGVGKIYSPEIQQQRWSEWLMTRGPKENPIGIKA